MINIIKQFFKTEKNPENELLNKLKNMKKGDSGVRFSRSGKVYIDKLVFLRREEVIKDIKAFK